MSSHLFACVVCFTQRRLLGYVPPDFDNVCDECRAQELPEPEPKPKKVAKK